jgi:alpha-ketoglutarate-dependent taurine dioxygenase
MAQVPKFPSYLFFYCDVVPKEGGETPFCLSNAVYERINQERPEFVKNLLEKNVRYTRILPEEDDPSSPIGRGWKSTFLTEDKKVAEERCLEHGGSFEWLPNGCLKTISKPLPAIKLDPRTNKNTWFNSIVAVYYGWRDSRNKPEEAITYGDGTPISPDDIERTSQILDELSVSFKWHQGDVVLVDNKLALHARKTFTPPRRILAALFQ